MDAAGAAWAEFDAGWYLRSYPQVRGALFDSAESSVLAYYREQGQQRRHSPNPFFDEAMFLRVDATAADAVRDGQAASGFALYCRNLGRHRKPHWLFDEVFYRRQYPDLTDARLAANGLVNGYDHFLRHGARERRIGSPFFDPAVHDARLEPGEIAEAQRVGGFVAWIARLHARETQERPTSHYFDPAWHLRRYPAVAELIAKRRALSALHHYLTNEAATEFDPIPQFSEQFYLKRYPDVAAAVRRGDFRNGYEHFVHHGAFELRQPCQSIDLKYYVDTHRSVRADLKRGEARDAFVHYLRIGHAQGLPAVPSADEAITDGQVRTLFRLRAQTLVPLLVRRGLDFSHDGNPPLSAVMTMRDGFAQTLQTLASLRANFPGAMELILIDLGSTDGTAQLERCVHGATVLRFETDIGVLPGRNAGIQGATAQTLLFIGNEVELAPGAVAAGLDRLASDAGIGAVGGKLVGPDGRLREAGCMVWRDGSTRAYQRDAPACAPEANFVRAVDYCSADFLMARTDLLRTLEGFDTVYAPGSSEDADLGLRIAASGHRVVYDPSIVVHRLATAAIAPGADVTQALETFVERHSDELAARPIAGPAAEIFARTAARSSFDKQRRRCLFLSPTIPLRMLGGGAVRCNDMIAAMVSIGVDVTVFPVLPHAFDLAAVYGDSPDAVEVMHDRTIDELADFLDRRAGYFDSIWVAGIPTLDRVRPFLASAIGAGGAARIILDIARIAALERPVPPDETADPQAEFVNASICRQFVAVGHHEAGWLRGIGLDPVAVIGPVRVPAPTPRGFAERGGLLFVGAIDAAGTPNHDALCWFVDAVLPLVEETLGWETRLTVAGRNDDPMVLDRFRGHPRVTLRGPLVDLTHQYDAHRVFVAPTRFAAGLPYKVYEAAAHGLPVVASDVVSGQMAWRDGEELLSAAATDPARTAEHIVRLYRDEALWQRLRDAALARLAADNGPDRAVLGLRALLG